MAKHELTPLRCTSPHTRFHLQHGSHCLAMPQQRLSCATRSRVCRRCGAANRRRGAMCAGPLFASRRRASHSISFSQAPPTTSCGVWDCMGSPAKHHWQPAAEPFGPANLKRLCACHTSCPKRVHACTRPLHVCCAVPTLLSCAARSTAARPETNPKRCGRWAPTRTSSVQRGTG